MRNTRTMSAPAPNSPPAGVELSIRVRAARAQFAAAIAAVMLSNVAAGVAPRWWHSAPAGSFDRWDAFDRLEGLLNYAAGTFTGPGSSELREQLEDARPHLPATVIGAGFTLADTIDAQTRQLAGARS